MGAADSAGFDLRCLVPGAVEMSAKGLLPFWFDEGRTVARGQVSPVDERSTSEFSRDVDAGQRDSVVVFKRRLSVIAVIDCGIARPTYLFGSQSRLFGLR